MPLPTKFVELDFPGLHSTADYTGWRSDFTVAGTANEILTDFPPCISVQLKSINFNLIVNIILKLSTFSEFQCLVFIRNINNFSK